LETTISMVKLKKILVSIQEDLEKISNKQKEEMKNSKQRNKILKKRQKKRLYVRLNFPLSFLLEIINKLSHLSYQIIPTILLGSTHKQRGSRQETKRFSIIKEIKMVSGMV
ncbi:hypothetical protein, partial [Bacillus cereus]|uniref:hypothetical protein n=1 Tax=Bacillus cereus TaxID=1396 RepID=UPI002852CF93